MNKQLIATFLGLLVWSISYGQIFSNISDHFPAGFTVGGSMDGTAADLDQDGHLDLIIAREARENVVFYNQADGTFKLDEKRLLPKMNPNAPWPGEDSEEVAAVDFDQDGDLDLLFASEDTPGHELLWNDGKGHFSFSAFQFPTSIANALAIIDWNKDSYPDVLIGNRGQNQLFVNQKDGTFLDQTKEVLPKNQDHSQDIKVIDLDLDGDLDLVEGVEYGGSNIYFNEGNKFVEKSDWLPQSGEIVETRKVTVGDLNGDQYPDIYFCNVAWVSGANPKDLLFLNDGKGGFTDASAQLPFFFGFTLDALFLDLNDDGKLDILTTGIGPGSTRTLINDGNANFTDESSRYLPDLGQQNGIGLFNADFNADGVMDIYICQHGIPDILLTRKKG